MGGRLSLRHRSVSHRAARHTGRRSANGAHGRRTARRLVVNELFLGALQPVGSRSHKARVSLARCAALPPPPPRATTAAGPVRPPGSAGLHRETEFARGGVTSWWCYYHLLTAAVLGRRGGGLFCACTVVVAGCSPVRSLLVLSLLSVEREEPPSPPFSVPHT